MPNNIVRTLDDAIKKLNTLYNSSSSSPNSGEEDYLIWTDLLNVGIGIWESEEGMLWMELFTKLANASDGDQSISQGTTSYALPSDFSFPNSAFVWTGTGDQKTAYKVLRPQDVQLLENDTGRWCYFLMNSSPTLEFNPNLTDLNDGDTISYNYYKFATPLATGTDIFEMSDPMFAVYYALSELKKEEGDVSALQIATQKLEAMKTRNYMVSENQDNSTIQAYGSGFGTTGNRQIR